MLWVLGLSTGLATPLAAGLSPAAAAAAPAAERQDAALAASLTLAGQRYWLRWARAGQYEFTPAGQEDLGRWSEMVTVWRYSGIMDGEQLAAQANRVLAAYQQAGGRILRTASRPRTARLPAEHGIVAQFQRSGFAEFTATRLLLHRGGGVALIYGRRFYGSQASRQLGAWVAQQGSALESALFRAEAAVLLQAAAP
jgi:hypothetical protein